MIEPAELDRALGRQLATLALSALAPIAPAAARQAVTWSNLLARLGMDVPLVVVHDLGWLLSGTRGRRPRVADEAPGSPRSRYAALLEAVADTPAVVRLGTQSLRDELVAVLLARLLADAWRVWSGRTARTGSRAAGAWFDAMGPLPLESPRYDRPLTEQTAGFDPSWVLPFLAELGEHRETLILRLEQVDLGPLRLLGMLPGGIAPPDLAGLHQLLATPGAAEAARLSLELLPSLLETKRPASVQRFAVGGYASVEPRGSPSALVPSELAHDDEMFQLKALTDDLLYFGHERPSEGARREQMVLVDASASMRGMREVFARGLAIALAKKLSLMGAEVSLRFFDSRLHRRVPVGTALGHELPYLLCFRSERGRNYVRVFEDLHAELERDRARGRRDVAVTFITHAECHIPQPVVERLARVARLYAVFVLPSRPVSLGYLSLLQGHQIVTLEALTRAGERRRRGIEIVEDVARRV